MEIIDVGVKAKKDEKKETVIKAAALENIGKSGWSGIGLQIGNDLLVFIPCVSLDGIKEWHSGDEIGECGKEAVKKVLGGMQNDI